MSKKLMKSPMDVPQKHEVVRMKKPLTSKPIAVRPTPKTKPKPKGLAAEATKKVAPPKKPEPLTEVDLKDITDEPVKEIVLLWTKAGTTPPKEAANAAKVTCCVDDDDFMEKVKNAYLSLRFGAPPLVFLLQFGNVRLEMRTPTEIWRAKPLPPAGHLITLNLQHFSTAVEFVGFVEKKTKQQTDNCAFDCHFELPEDTSQNPNNSKSTKYSKFREAFGAKWKSFISTIHWNLLILSIFFCLIGFYVKLFVADESSQPIWIRLLHQIKDFLYSCYLVIHAPFE